jgi:hypothetical protein
VIRGGLPIVLEGIVGDPGESYDPKSEPGGNQDKIAWFANGNCGPIASSRPSVCIALCEILNLAAFDRIHIPKAREDEPVQTALRRCAMLTAMVCEGYDDSPE